MNTRKLFQVLVTGGALLGMGCLEEEPAPDAATTDAGVEGDAPPVECGFCPNPECCVTDGAGVSQTRDGMMCCWGTSC